MPESKRDLHGSWLSVSGPVLTLVVIIGVEVLVEDRLPVPDLAIVLLAPILYSVLVGGMRWGLISTVLALVYYAYHLSTPGTPFQHYTTRKVEQLIVTALIAPVVVLSLGILKRRLDDLLVRERALREEAEARLRQQAAVARLGGIALGAFSLDALFDAAVREVCSGLEVEYAKVLELVGNDELFVRAGVGWREGVVRTLRIRAGEGSQAGYTLRAKEPVVVLDLARETRFSGFALLTEHEVASGVSIIIEGRERPFGTLGAHTRDVRKFTSDDANFLKSIANVLAAAVERERVEEELLASETKFRQMAENLEEVLFLTDLEESQLIYVNAAYEKVWGRSVASLYLSPKSWLEAVHPEDRARAELALDEMASTGRFDLGFRIIRPDGEVRWIRNRVFPVRDAPIDGVQRAVGIAVDETDHRRAEENAQSLLIEQTARVAAEAGIRARDDVLAFVSHDLRSPLNTIELGAEMLHEEIDDPELAGGVDAIRWAARRMNRLIDDLLAAATMQAGRFSIVPEVADAVAMARDVIHALRAEARRRGVSLEIDAHEGLPFVHADEGRVVQALSNLVANAIKFTAPGGRVTVRAVHRGDELLFAVEDTGAGIAEDDLGRLFDRFWQARAGHDRGAGLGLPITKAIVEAHGGAIWVDSKKGVGSTFYFTLPSVPRAAAAPEREHASDRP